MYAPLSMFHGVCIFSCLHYMYAFNHPSMHAHASFECCYVFMHARKYSCMQECIHACLSFATPTCVCSRKLQPAALLLAPAAGSNSSEWRQTRGGSEPQCASAVRKRRSSRIAPLLRLRNCSWVCARAIIVNIRHIRQRDIVHLLKPQSKGRACMNFLAHA